METTPDASPWGFGATLRVNGVYISWYTDAITEQDAECFNTFIGSWEGQQTWESLNILIALRTWKTWWSRLQICLQVKADNITALSLLCRLKGSSTALNIIARELALEFGDGSFFPSVVTHVPGIALKTVDSLSRRHQPNFKFTLPHPLVHVPQVHPEARDDQFWQALHPPKVHWKRGAEDSEPRREAGGR